MLMALPRMTPELAGAIIDWRDTNSDVSASGGAENDTYQRLNPYDQSLVATYQDSGAEDAELAIAAARRAFDRGPWPRTPAAERGAVLRALDRARGRVHLALGERGLGVRAAVADRVPVVADAHDSDGATVDHEPRRRVRGEVGECTDRGAHDALLLSLAATRARISGRSEPTGNTDSTSSKKPSTTNCSASCGGMPRLSR